MNTQSAIELLNQLVTYESVSGDDKRVKNVSETSTFLINVLKEVGCKTKIIKTRKNPLVIGYLDNKAKKTIGIYGHYDVQEEGDTSLWHSSPFKVDMRGTKIFGRGVADNKGHIAQNISAIAELQSKKELKVNVLFIFEGEEEIGSVNFEEAIQQVPEVKDVDVFFVTDSQMIDRDTPLIEYGLRGLLYYEIHVKSGEKELHSGLYGGLVVSAPVVLSRYLASVQNSEQEVMIPNFYDGISTMTKKESNILRKNSQSKKEVAKSLKVNDLYINKRTNFWSAHKAYPTFDIHNFHSGHDAGIKTSIPAQARATFSFRLVSHQDPKKIMKEIEKYTKHFFKQYPVEYTLILHNTTYPVQVDVDNTYITGVNKVFEKYFKNKPVLDRSGGSVAAAEILYRLYKKPMISTGFSLPDDNMHAPDENIDRDLFEKGRKILLEIYSIIHFW